MLLIGQARKAISLIGCVSDSCSQKTAGCAKKNRCYSKFCGQEPYRQAHRAEVVQQPPPSKEICVNDGRLDPSPHLVSTVVARDAIVSLEIGAIC